MKFSYRTEHNAKAMAAFWGKPIDNKAPYDIKALSDDDAVLFVFDILGWPFNDINAMIRDLSAIKPKNLLVRLNSPGGDPIDTFAFYHALKNYSAKVTVRIEALAASAASFLALAGSEVQAYPSSLLMIHNSYVMAVGNRFELAEIADILEKIDGNMQDIYTAKTKIGKREMSDMMKAETWFTAKEAKERGFVDTILEGKAVKAAFDLSMFANAPDGIGDDSQGRDLTRKETEHALRQAGASREYARAVAAKRADASDTEIDAVAAELKKITAIIGG
jgi:ATP-dependent Clp protease protease subunit